MLCEPSVEAYIAALKKFTDLAKSNPTKNYLQIQSFAGHGYHVGGFQQVPTPYYNPDTGFYKMIEVEKLVREAVKGIRNGYIIAFFACCREVKNLSDLINKSRMISVMGSKVEGLRGGNIKAEKQIGNFMFCFGCQPAYGVKADTKYIKNLIDLFTRNWEPELGSITLPDIFAKVISSDAMFETVSCNLARKLMLLRQDTMIGHKHLVYAYDPDLDNMDETRKRITDFFKKVFGFKEEDILMIDRN